MDEPWISHGLSMDYPWIVHRSLLELRPLPLALFRPLRTPEAPTGETRCFHVGTPGDFFATLEAPWGSMGAAGRTRGVRNPIFKVTILGVHFDGFLVTED